MVRLVPLRSNLAAGHCRRKIEECSWCPASGQPLPLAAIPQLAFCPQFLPQRLRQKRADLSLERLTLFV